MLIPIAAFVFAMASSIYSLVRARKQQDEQSRQAMMSMGCMMLFMPLMSLWLAFEFPVGIGVYWAFNSLLGLIQMIILDLIYTPDRVIATIMVEETIVRRQKETAYKKEHQLVQEFNASKE